jgi:ubiquinol-cytochrome c reductase cytochrome b subunit
VPCITVLFLIQHQLILHIFWNFGIYAITCLLIQIITGVALAMHYAAEVNIAFYSVEHIMRDGSLWVAFTIHSC